MCGRFVRTTSPDRLALRYGALDAITDPVAPSWNVAPSHRIPAVLDVVTGTAEGRRLGLLRWGFVPGWARSPDEGPRPINARIEGAAASRLFASALARRRCIVPLDAWYEWTEEAGARQPWLLRPTVEGPVAVAALWSTWRDPAGPDDAPPLGTVALITTEARGRAADVHHRMPLLVPDALLDPWLDPRAPADATLVAALTDGTPELDVVRVSRRVNDVRNDDPELVAAAQD